MMRNDTSPAAPSTFDLVRGVGKRVAGSELLRKGAWGLGDQAIMSATNFLTMVLLARHLSVAGFGAFALVYTGLILPSTFQQALITRPLNVLGGARDGSEYRAYVSTCGLLQLAYATLVSALAVGLALVAYAAGSSLYLLLLALVPAIFAGQVQEFVRQVLYTRRRVSAAFANDVLGYGTQVPLLLLLPGFGLMSGANAVLVIAITSFVAALAGLWTIRGDLGWGVSRRFAQENWEFGKWLSGAGGAFWLSGQLYPILAAAMLGVTAMGQLRVMQNFVAPAHIVINAFHNLITPQAGREYQRSGKQALARLLLGGGLLALGLLLTLWLGVGLFVPRLLRLLYGDKYASYAPLYWLFVVSYLVMFVEQTLAVGLMALQRTRTLFFAQLISVPMTFTVGVASIYALGLYGVLAGSIVCSVLYTLILIVTFAKAGTAERRPVSAPSNAPLQVEA